MIEIDSWRQTASVGRGRSATHCCDRRRSGKGRRSNCPWPCREVHPVLAIVLFRATTPHCNDGRDVRIPPTRPIVAIARPTIGGSGAVLQRMEASRSPPIIPDTKNPIQRPVPPLSQPARSGMKKRTTMTMMTEDHQEDLCSEHEDDRTPSGRGTRRSPPPPPSPKQICSRYRHHNKCRGMGSDST